MPFEHAWSRRIAVGLAAFALLAGCDSNSGTHPGTNPNPTGPNPPEWASEAVFYHAYVRSFADSDGDGAGDFAAFRSKLDHIEALGATAILLLPVANADRDIYGGYTPVDLLASEADYGTLADFAALVDDVHARGLRILIDFPLDAAADTHPLFVDSASETSAFYHDWFSWLGETCRNVPGIFVPSSWHGGRLPGYCYWSKWADDAPEWNFDNPAVQEMFFDVARTWLQRGVDGFRLDAAQHLSDTTSVPPFPTGTLATHSFLARLVDVIKDENPEALIVAEVTSGLQSDVERYHADGIDMVFDYPLYFNGILPAITAQSAPAFRDAIESKVASSARSGGLGGVFLGNHDVPGAVGRIADLLGGDFPRIAQAAALLLSIPGTPFIYYGEEIGLSGSQNPETSEIWTRNPMHWDGSAGRGFTTGTPWAPFFPDGSDNVEAQAGVEGGLLETYRSLLSIRTQNEALVFGDYLSVESGAGHVIAFLRTSPAQTILAVYNLSSGQTVASLDLAAAGITSATPTDLIFGVSQEAVTPANASAYPLMLEPNDVRWLELE